MIRKIIKIDADKCNGCGLCVSACHEGAIGMVEGKAKLQREDYCDGLGNCLPACPTGAITFEEREAEVFNEEAVKINMKIEQPEKSTFGCPGARLERFERKDIGDSKSEMSKTIQTHLKQWPVQIKLVPPNALYFKNANLLIAADCTAFSYGNFHNEFMKNKITLIGCPKLDDGDYNEKLTAILKINDIKSVTVVKMEVPCCGGIENAVKAALKNCGKLIQWQAITISTDGRILDI